MTLRSEAAKREAPLARRQLAEFFGTSALVFVAVAGDAAGRITGGEVGVAARAVGPALMVAALIYAIGDVSGAHFNPVVTLAFCLRGLFPIRAVPLYWGAQLSGGVVGAWAVALLLGPAVQAGVSTAHVPPATAMGLEAVLTLILLTVILGTADRHRIIGPDAALAVGATISLCGLIALPLDGASMNPARSLGPALVTGRLDEVWIYLVGPAIGAIVASIVAVLLHGRAGQDPAARRAAQGDGRHV